MNSHRAGVLKWTMGARSQLTVSKLWSVVRGWECCLYITDGWKIYPCFIDDCEHLVSKTAMTRVEGENSRLRHCALERTAVAKATSNRRMSIARLHRKTFCSKSIEMLEASIQLLNYYLRHWTIPIFS